MSWQSARRVGLPMIRKVGTGKSGYQKNNKKRIIGTMVSCVVLIESDVGLVVRVLREV